ncbi:hypothetical protein [Flavobacterium sp. 3HN19-14]|uniref:hypothetical protein n=1 Tax=Flavobacterium sp. 3HN19-14 TaxID=3448133 RepID=UPI003EE13601
MKISYYSIILVVLMAFSCQDDAAKRDAEKQKDIKKKEAIFTVINNSWNFTERPLNPQTQALISNWAEWRLFLTDLHQKPKSSISAFRQKAIVLATRANDLNNNIPEKFAKPEIKARIAALVSKVRSLDLYVNLRDIPAEKIPVLIAEINAEILSLTTQMEEIVVIEQIPVEQGESDMIKMLDTSRAIPSTRPQNNIYKKIN